MKPTAAPAALLPQPDRVHAVCACGIQLGRANKSGKCRSCLAKHLNADPVMIAKRRAAQVEFFAKPETKAALRERLAVTMANLSDDERERRRVAGQALARNVLSRPDVVARTLSRDARERAGRARTDTTLAWCPPHLRGEYRGLVRQGFRAAEARAMIEPEIPGTVAHAQREIANRKLANRLRHERQKAQAY